MSVRVNLLPREVEERNRANRRKVLLGAAGAAFLALLVVLYLFQLGRVSNAEEQLEAELAELAALRSDLAMLQEFEELQARADQADTVLSTALGGEASLAGVLQDLAAVMPTDADLVSLGVTFTAAPEQPDLGGTRPVFGNIVAAGRTVRGHAPGLERLLLEFEKVAAFGDVYFSASTLDTENGVATFGIEVDLGPEVLTLRYANGLPEGLR